MFSWEPRCGEVVNRFQSWSLGRGQGVWWWEEPGQALCQLVSASCVQGTELGPWWTGCHGSLNGSTGVEKFVHPERPSLHEDAVAPSPVC